MREIRFFFPFLFSVPSGTCFTARLNRFKYSVVSGIQVPALAVIEMIVDFLRHRFNSGILPALASPPFL